MVLSDANQAVQQYSSSDWAKNEMNYIDGKTSDLAQNVTKLDEGAQAVHKGSAGLHCCPGWSGSSRDGDR